MENLNDYNQALHENSFKKTDTYKKLLAKYTNVRFEKFVELVALAEFDKTPGTPRQSLVNPRKPLVSAVPWYYLNFLDSSKTMYDLGCGYNFFKPYFRDLVGIGAETDPSHIFFDVHDIVNEVFYENHVNYYDSVFSINALHFHPIEKFQSICLNFARMLKPGGRGFLAMNVVRMMEQSQIFPLPQQPRAYTNFVEQMEIDTHLLTQVDHYLRTQIDNFPFKILVLDIDLSVNNAVLDGNIRLVFENEK